MRDSKSTLVKLEIPQEGIVQMSLCRGAAMNTLTWEMLDALMNALHELRTTPPRALIVTGEGKVFCGGAHLKYFTDPDSPLTNNPAAARDPYVRRILDVFGQLRALPCPTIAAINGHALGGGMEMAVACDFRLMSAAAFMGQPEVRFGLAPGGNGIQQLVKLIGRTHALDMLLTGDVITADAALSYGLVSSVSAPDALLTDAVKFARRFLSSGPFSVGITKRATYRTETLSQAESDAIALDAVYESFSNAESREGISAFVEKRCASFVLGVDTGK